MTKKCLKHHAYLFYGLLIYLIDSSLPCMLTHMCIVLFSSHVYYMVNSKLSFETNYQLEGIPEKLDPGP